MKINQRTPELFLNQLKDFEGFQGAGVGQDEEGPFIVLFWENEVASNIHEHSLMKEYRVKHQIIGDISLQN